MTKQEMFDRAWRGLKAQGFERSVTPGTYDCLYLGPGGKRCAWGHVDPEGTSCKEAEGKSVEGLHTRGIGLAATLDAHELRFAQRLQEIHDVAHGTMDLEANLRTLAHKYSLTIPDEDP